MLSLADSSGNTVLHYAAGGAVWFRGISADASAPKQGSGLAWLDDHPSKYDGYATCRAALHQQEGGISEDGTRRTTSTAMSKCGFFARMVSLLLAQGHSDPSFIPSVINARNHDGETPLHLAAIANDPVVTRLLVSSGADVEAQNSRGLVPSETAALWGSSEALETLSRHRRVSASTEISRELVWKEHARSATHNSGTLEKDNRLSDLLGVLGRGIRDMSKSGGWDSGVVLSEELRAGANARSGVLRKTRITAQEFADDFVSLSRPALISPFGFDEINEWSLLESWSKSELLGAYGDLTVHPKQPGYSESSPMTLKQFVSSWQPTSSGGGESRGYLREASTATYRLLRDLEWENEAATADPTDGESVAGIPFFNTSRLRAHSFELNLGPAGSGSGMRVCGHLVDVLVFGERRWFLTPPRHAKVYSGSVFKWFTTNYRADSYRSSHELVEVTQRPGEMMYVPSGWGHAVINTANVVGYGLHFQAFGAGMGERQRWAGVTQQLEALLQSQHPTRPHDPMRNSLGKDFNA